MAVRSGDTNQVISVQYGVSGSGVHPAAQDDFVNGVWPTGSITFDTGESRRIITIDVRGHTSLEPDESFTLTLYLPSGTAQIAVAATTGVIRNDDLGVGSLVAGTVAFDRSPARLGDPYASPCV